MLRNRHTQQLHFLQFSRVMRSSVALELTSAITFLVLSSFRGTQRQFSENICSEDDLRCRIFGTFVVKFLACPSLLGFSNI